MSIEMSAPEQQLLTADATWAGVKRRYFYDRTYYLPMMVKVR